MKSIIAFIILSVSTNMAWAEPAAALKSISCEEGDFKVVLEAVNSDQSNQTSYQYSLYKEGSLLQPSKLDIPLTNEGFESSFLNSYIWGFEGAESVLLVGLPEMEVLTPGTYTEAKSDLFVVAGDEAMSGSTVSCTVVIE